MSWRAGIEILNKFPPGALAPFPPRSGTGDGTQDMFGTHIAY